MKFKLGKLFGHKPATPAADPSRLAVAQLLLEIARADLSADAAEHAVIRKHLQDAFALDDAAVDTLVAQASARVEKAVSLHGTVEALNRSMDAPTKSALVGALWRVAYADGRLDPYEEALLRRICDLLYVPHSSFIREKLAAHPNSP